ncbi:20140_t:CDS:2 [Rhizophagus irregularis]|uniref:Uncharacterized protein n=1 Tax=Rhizophagus irregularis (strain DAOM 197198w) TaxID=1432141 RepID=A0A015L7E5_RHIIW|nr:hypothetical protein RirG_040500 [Rhizophagus irregularis DAOM 197198w]CAG8564710.1 20140_t:CDS:2 [Rhizophagus irregularis]
MSTDEFHSNQNDQQPQQPQQINQREITNQIIYTCFKEAIIGIEGYIGPIKASTSPSYYRIS